MRISDWSSDVCSSDLAIGRYGLADAHAIVAGERAQAALEALADGAELPFGAVAIDFAEDHRGLGRSIFRQVIAHDFGAGLVVDRTRSEEHTSAPVTNAHIVCRLLLEKKTK